MTSANRYRSYLLGLLMLILAFNFVDRLAFGLLLQNIKDDLHLSDTQMGFLGGIAFALFYAVMGIPIAWWADRGNRVRIISITTGLWSVAVALCGLAASYGQLLLIRIGIAVGEAGCIPPAHSLIADYFSREERPRAIARYMQGGGVAVLVGYFGAGWLNELYGWRQTFMLLAVPGCVLSILAWISLREPRQRGGGAAAAGVTLDEEGAGPPQPKLKDVCATLWANVTFRHLLFCFAVNYFFSYGIGNWLPTYMIRSYGLQTGELGGWMTVIWGIGGMLGMYLGGEWSSRLASNDERRQLQVMAVMFIGFGIVSASVYLAHTRHLAFALLGLSAIGINAVYAPLFAMIQSLVPQRMRATSIALIYLFANLIGMGFGPLVAGALSDSFRPLFGQESLRYALLALCPGYVWGAWHLWRAGKSVNRDLNAVQAAERGELAHGAS
jgi:MFS family permease